ncbi:MAG: hypothetical protein B7Z37_26580 [Verrucomicrobia bacterium 12-59-8]|nr:MAG: hypothetical protein B7Z37_26580 [Verrucomicrobia bacterium 12-59-8]
MDYLLQGVYKQAAYISQEELRELGRRAKADDQLVKDKKLVAAGLAVQARDTGRVLMLQRYHDKKDPAGGMWEFPGGHIEDGESPLDAARREWEEETGMQVPSGSLQSEWNYGVYRGHVWSIASEKQLTLHGPDKDRKLNPDDPDGDKIEAVAWWKPELLIGNPAVRQELRASMHLVQRSLDRDRHLESRYAARLTELQRRRDPDRLKSKTASYLTQGIYIKVARRD